MDTANRMYAFMNFHFIIEGKISHFEYVLNICVHCSLYNVQYNSKVPSMFSVLQIVIALSFLVLTLFCSRNTRSNEVPLNKNRFCGK